MKPEHKEKQSFSGAEKSEISHHLAKAKEISNHAYNSFRGNWEEEIAKALEEAEEKGYNDAFNDIIFRKGIIKKVKGRKYIYFKVAMSDVKKCVQRWKNETK